jgi:hypothetical protein
MTKKKRRGCPSRQAVVLYEDPGGTLQEQVAWARGVIKALGYPCLLCEAQYPRVLGRVRVRHEAVEQLEGPLVALRHAGTLTLWYALCEECSSLEDAANRVEARMRASAGAA